MNEELKQMSKKQERRNQYLKHLGEEVVEEAFGADDMSPKAKTEVELFLGRMQPLTAAHVKIIGAMRNPVIALVKGAKSSQDKEKNPFDATFQRQMIKRVFPQAKVIEVASGYVPEIISMLRQSGLEVTKMVAGSDRVAGYQKQIDGLNAKLQDAYKMSCKVVEIERSGDDISATKVRNAIKTGDMAAFKKMMPKQLWGDFNAMQNMLKEEPTNNVGGGNIAPHPKPMVGMLARKYRDFLDQLQKKTKTKYDNAEEEK